MLRDGVLDIVLVAGSGTWYPEGRSGPGRVAHAFGTGDSLSNPGPLIRVPAGTVVRARIRNTLGEPLRVHGLFSRPGAARVITVGPGGEDSVTLRLDAAGTYHYWGSTRGAATLADRTGEETQLVGAIVVDAPGAVRDDHVFVIGLEDDSVERRVRAAVVNGLSWPHSHISTVQLGDTVRMRWVNASGRFHAMSLHGGRYRVAAHGDMAQDTAYEAGDERLVVTELLAPGETMSLRWVPERAGNWLMHCHVASHISPSLRTRPSPSAADSHDHATDALAGIVTGWRVVPRAGALASASRSPLRPREIRLIAQSAPGRSGLPASGFVIQEGGAAPAPDSVLVPGPPLVLMRDQPVRIMVVNHLAEPTSVHWHGIDVESYFDGVPGWSGEGDRIAPAVEPGDSFEVHFTPRRAGTFIYHSHLDEARQLAAGMYGPIIVLEPGRRHDPEVDRIWVLSQSGLSTDARLMLNGSTDPVLDMNRNRRYRIRLINISPDAPLTLSVLADTTPVVWRLVAKDGADIPAARLRTVSAVQRVGPGETYDFEFTPIAAGELTMRAVSPDGGLRLGGRIRVREDEES